MSMTLKVTSSIPGIAIFTEFILDISRSLEVSYLKQPTTTLYTFLIRRL
jgi:hypothetical protein